MAFQEAPKFPGPLHKLSELPFPPKTETVEKDSEKEIIRMAQRKLWAKEKFRKATKGQGFMRRKIDEDLVLENGAILKVNYSRSKYHEVLSMKWINMSPKRNLSYAQEILIVSSYDPRLSTSSYVSTYHKVENGNSFYHPGGVGAIELDKVQTIKEIRAFIAYYL